jgi:hypothetical protein
VDRGPEGSVNVALSPNMLVDGRVPAILERNEGPAAALLKTPVEMVCPDEAGRKREDGEVEGAGENGVACGLNTENG